MANVRTGRFKDDVLGNISSEVANAIQPAADEYQVKIVTGMSGLSLEFFREKSGSCLVCFSEWFLSLDYLECEIDVAVGIGGNGIGKHARSDLIEPFDSRYFWHGIVFEHLAAAFGNTDRLVGDALKIGCRFHSADDHAQICGDWLEANDDLHAEVIDLDFELILIFIISDGLIAELFVSLKETVDGVLQVALGSCRHGERGFPKFLERAVEITEDVIA